MDPIGAARLVFGEFQAEYAQRMGRGGVWSLSFDDDDAAKLGLTGAEVGTGIDVLLQKGLIKPMGMDGVQLTGEGKEACLHPELLDACLAPRTIAKTSAPSVTIHGGNVQIGSHNTQNVTYRSILQEALDAVDERNDVPAPVAAALRRLVDFPDLEDLLATAAAKVGDRT